MKRHLSLLMTAAEGGGDLAEGALYGAAGNVPFSRPGEEDKQSKHYYFKHEKEELEGEEEYAEEEEEEEEEEGPFPDLYPEEKPMKAIFRNTKHKRRKLDTANGEGKAFVYHCEPFVRRSRHQPGDNNADEDSDICTYVDRLPEEVLFRIFQFTSANSVKPLSLVCRRWKKISKDAMLWFSLFGDCSLPIRDHHHKHPSSSPSPSCCSSSSCSSSASGFDSDLEEWPFGTTDKLVGCGKGSVSPEDEEAEELFAEQDVKRNALMMMMEQAEEASTATITAAVDLSSSSAVCAYDERGDSTVGETGASQEADALELGEEETSKIFQQLEPLRCAKCGIPPSQLFTCAHCGECSCALCRRLCNMCKRVTCDSMLCGSRCSLCEARICVSCTHVCG